MRSRATDWIMVSTSIGAVACVIAGVLMLAFMKQEEMDAAIKSARDDGIRVGEAGVVMHMAPFREEDYRHTAWVRGYAEGLVRRKLKAEADQ